MNYSISWYEYYETPRDTRNSLSPWTCITYFDNPTKPTIWITHLHNFDQSCTIYEYDQNKTTIGNFYMVNLINNKMPEAKHAFTFLISFNHFSLWNACDDCHPFDEKLKCAYLLTICHTTSPFSFTRRNGVSYPSTKIFAKTERGWHTENYCEHTEWRKLK